MAEHDRIETIRLDGARKAFIVRDHGDYLESVAEIPEPHEFTANVQIGEGSYAVVFKEHEHTDQSTARDNNMRAALIHVVADAAVSVLVIGSLLLARSFGWFWMDPVAGIIGAGVTASWSIGLIRDTRAILLDMNPDRSMERRVRAVIEGDGDLPADLHLWRLGPRHIAAIVSVVTTRAREADYYRDRLARFSGPVSRHHRG